MLTASPFTDRRSGGSSRLATMKSTIWPVADHSVGAGEQKAEMAEGLLNASATTSSAAMAANIARRTTPSSGSTTLVSQA